MRELYSREELSKAGIYMILCLRTWLYYVGSTVCLAGRWSDHRGELNAGVHRNYLLQEEWTKYGEEQFMFFIVEPVELTEEERSLYEEKAKPILIPIEQKWLDQTKCYDRGVGYNLNKRAGAPPIRYGENSDEALLTMDQIREIRKRYADGERLKDIARDYPVKKLNHIVSYSSYYENDGLQDKIKEMRKANSYRFRAPLTPEEEAKLRKRMSGEGNHAASVTKETVQAIRSEKGDFTLSDIAASYNTTTTIVSRILRNDTWYDPEYVPAPKWTTTKKRKLNFETAEEIRRLHREEGLTPKALSEKFEINFSHTCQILNGNAWKKPSS